ncbi:putative oxidoreductase,short chain dehydrogenase [Stachybotrys elegans]|uniref:Oxidoreductase,short chain dehydrogenase n=1 Tax=Stachybotrys elegans TaxID=80388 RepID=A0A8K0SCR0_9HYPO|nr:putative oxidoreductase,short chain dehydrogenase [Stachybotrys elegans]
MDLLLISSAFGLLTISFLLTQLVRLALVYLRPSRLSRFAHASPSGAAPWALVTGASDGIGRAFAQELAAAGFNVALHGRNRDKLSKVVELFQAEFPQREFTILVADAGLVPCGACLETTGPSPELVAMQQQLSSLHLTVLINNAGGGTGIFQPVSAAAPITTAKNTSLNALFPLELTRMLLPQLARNGPSLVVNLSTMGDAGFPLIASYSASKAFTMAITRALRLEMLMNNEPVEVLGIKVGRVTGTGPCRDPSSTFLPSAETMAKAALSKAGYGGGIVVGYWAHAIQQLGASLFAVLPEWVEDNVKIGIMRKMEDTRKTKA